MLEFVEQLSGRHVPCVSIFEEPLWHPSHADYLVLDVCKVLLEDGLSDLLLNLKLDLHLTEALLQLELKVVRLLLEIERHFGDLGLIDPILSALLNHFVHLDEHFSPHSNLIDDFGLLANIMVSVGAKQRAVGANPHAVLNTDNLQLSPVLLAHFLL